MIIEKSINIERPVDVVFAFVADPRNDTIWCPKVKSVEPVPGSPGEGPGARFAVVHRPVPFLAPKQMDYSLVDWEPGRKIEWFEDDGHDRIAVTYTLEPDGGSTRLTQRDDAELAAPKILHPLMRIGIGADISGQLKRLRKHLEQTSETA